MSSNAPCEQCIKGSIHAGQPLGSEESIHGLNTYVIGNRTNPRGIIVVYTDVFGIPLPNNRLIADSYAKSGEWLVYMPDFFEGDPLGLKMADLLIPVDAVKQSKFAKYTGLLASMPSYILWSSRHKEGPTSDVCMSFLQKLRLATPADQKIGMVGFCWGGKYALRAGLESNMIEKVGVDGKVDKIPLVDAVVALHPSNLTFPGDVENLVVPTTCGWGEEDSFVTIESKSKVEDLHAKARQGGRNVPTVEHKVYKPGRHGFAVRGNPDDPLERACLEDSVTQVLEWFQRWL